MARINLLPWRAERRKQRENEFYAMLFGTLVLAALVAFGVHWHFGNLIQDQQARNKKLNDEIAIFDRQIAEIDRLQQTRDRLTARQQVIEQLQASRSQMVHLFDELVRTIPEGVRLDSIKQTGDMLTLEGVAQSNARVSAYMRGFESSDWLGEADLRITEARRGQERASRYNFTLRVQLKRPGEDSDSVESGE